MHKHTVFMDKSTAHLKKQLDFKEISWYNIDKYFKKRI